MAIVKLKKTTPPPALPGRMSSLSDLRDLISTLPIDRAPLDVEAVCSALGLRLVYEQMDNDMSGYLELRGDEWVVGVNVNHHRVRQRFTIAHELGHYVLHREQVQNFHDRTFARRNDNPTKMEREADVFAADLLMPEQRVVSLVQNGVRNLNELAAEMNVSSLAMRYRLQSLGYSLT